MEGNSTTQTVSGNAIAYFNSVDGVTVKGNIQPQSSGTFAQFDNCTGVVTS